MLLTPQFLKQLDPFSIRAKHAFRGTFRGERRSLNRGTGMEFTDYRAYEPGDDLRHVDWNIYARLDRLFIKLFHTDEDLPFVLLIDNSRSMEFGSPTKLMCAKQIAAALGYIALAHADSVTLYTCAERLSPMLPPTTSKSQFSRLTKALNAIAASGETRLTECLKQLHTYQRRAGMGCGPFRFFGSEGLRGWIQITLRTRVRPYSNPFSQSRRDGPANTFGKQTHRRGLVGGRCRNR